MLLFSILIELFLYYLIENEEENEENDSSYEIYIDNGIEIIFLILITYFLLKYKYYIHHFISIAIFVLLCFSLDLIQSKYPNTNSSTAITYITYILSESILYCYLKYLLANKYYYYMDVLFISGIFDTIIFFITLIVLIILLGNEFIFQFYLLYNEHGFNGMVTLFLLYFFCIGLFSSIIAILILDKLSPNHVII